MLSSAREKVHVGEGEANRGRRGGVESKATTERAGKKNLKWVCVGKTILIGRKAGAMRVSAMWVGWGVKGGRGE